MTTQAPSVSLIEIYKNTFGNGDFEKCDPGEEFHSGHRHNLFELYAKTVLEMPTYTKAKISPEEMVQIELHLSSDEELQAEYDEVRSRLIRVKR